MKYPITSPINIKIDCVIKFFLLVFIKYLTPFLNYGIIIPNLLKYSTSILFLFKNRKISEKSIDKCPLDALYYYLAGFSLSDKLIHPEKGNPKVLFWEEEDRWKEHISRKKFTEKKNMDFGKECPLLTEEKYLQEDVQKAENNWLTNVCLFKEDS